jgi:hypothetical protein
VTSPLPGRAALSRCRADAEMWRLMYLLRPFAQSQHLPPFRDQDKRRLWPQPGWNRARTPAEIPRQRAVPRGLPTRTTTQGRHR